MPSRARFVPPERRRRLRRGLLLLPLALVALGGSGCEVSVSREGSSERVRSVLESSEDPSVELSPEEARTLGEEAVAFYRARDFQSAWVSDDDLLEEGERILEALEEARKDGLDPALYNTVAVRRLRERARQTEDAGERAELMGTVDLLLTDGLSRYALDLARGALDPREAGLSWEIDRGAAPVEGIRRVVQAGTDPREALTALRPSIAYYDRLVEALERYRRIREEGGWPTLPGDATVEPGDSSSVVEILRERLVAEGDPDEAEGARAGRDDPARMDQAMVDALQHFQDRHGITDDGTLGPATRAALNVPVEDRILALELNLDRWRWLPRTLGPNFLLVNVAGYELEAVHDERPVLSMDVVVGQEAWQTPIFRDTVRHVVVNPYWNVPVSIALEEILPQVKADPDYLRRENLEVVRREEGNVEVLDPGDIDWEDVDSASMDFAFRQRPGPDNALGRIKFLFPNEHDVYLHDTPAGHLFSQASRAFSHGCIRVERPMDLARHVLEEGLEGDSIPDVEALIEEEGDEERWIDLDTGIPVYILYFTAWVDEDGTVRFHPDVYGRDEQLWKHVRTKLDGARASGRPVSSG